VACLFWRAAMDHHTDTRDEPVWVTGTGWDQEYEDELRQHIEMMEQAGRDIDRLEKDNADLRAKLALAQHRMTPRSACVPPS
jgi:hypothetical protein